jgi:copper chaperone
MTEFSIPDMSCGHCKAAVEEAVFTLDPQAVVVVDMAARRADVTSAVADAAVIAALAKVGFPAEVV